MQVRITLLLLTISCTLQAGIGRDADGWTTFTPSPDTRLIYVSSSTGNDATARWYAPTDGAIGDDAFNPTGAILPFATISNAWKMARDRHPDWLLLQRGDEFHEVFDRYHGRSHTERFLYGAYGSATNRPVLKTGVRSALSTIRGIENVALVSIDMYCNQRDPGSPDYAWGTNGNGGALVSINNGYHDNTNMFNFLIEDCVSRFGASGMILQNPSHNMSNVVVRRSLILDAYSTNSHSQGFYGGGITLLLEENVFDHNGWLIQGQADNNKYTGGATMFNHDTYFSTCNSVTFRDNIFLRSSSIGNKWTANAGVHSTTNIAIIDNLYVDGEIGIGIGGNSQGPVRFADITVVSNVMIDIGLSRPTGRKLGWGIDIADWDNGIVADNLFIRNTNELVNNVHAINITGTTSSNIVIRDNTIHGLRSATGILVTEMTDFWSVVVSGTKLQFPGLSSRLAQTYTPLSGISFLDSTYYTDRDSSEWFRVQSSEASFDAWRTSIGEASAVACNLSFPDPQRNLCSYMTSIGETGTYQAFIAAVRGQSKMNWRPELCAHAINEYLRAGFACLDVTTRELPDAVAGQPYSASLEAHSASGTVFWSLCVGSLPAGLGLTPDGVISGVPQPVVVLSETNSTFTVLAHDDLNVDPKTLSIVVVPEPTATAVAGFALLAARRKQSVNSDQ